MRQGKKLRDPEDKPVGTTPDDAPIAKIFRNNGSHRKKAAWGEGDFRNDNVLTLANWFFQLVVGEFYAIAQNADYKTVTQIDPVKALTNYQAFVCGFEQGLTAGADVMFANLYDAGWNQGYQLGYGIGYANGFQNGYSQGYAAGWQNEYATGYQDSTNQETWLGSINNVFDGVGGLLSGGTTNVSNITTILSDVETAGTVLASIFG
jgi:hypothetical protein